VIERLRAWARRHTERDRYSPVGIAFHWIMAFLVLLQLGWGWSTSFLPAGGDKLIAYQVHSAVGLPILILAARKRMLRQASKSGTTIAARPSRSMTSSRTCS